MFGRILKQICEKVRKREYVMTHHAREEMNNDDLSIYDIEHGILTGENIRMEIPTQRRNI
jgi:hypothetical protein